VTLSLRSRCSLSLLKGIKKLMVVSTGSTTGGFCGVEPSVVERVIAELVEASKRPGTFLWAYRRERQKKLMVVSTGSTTAIAGFMTDR